MLVVIGHRWRMVGSNPMFNPHS